MNTTTALGMLARILDRERTQHEREVSELKRRLALVERQLASQH